MKRHFLYILISALLFSVSCRKPCRCNDPSNPDCENFDPCYGHQKVEADFKIGQIWSAIVAPSIDPYKAYVEDTIFPIGSSIEFRANLEGAAYTWLIGTEVLHTRNISRGFDNKLPTGRYSVTLIVEKAPDLSCFPNDDGKDTFTRNFYLVKPCSLKTVGTYRGVIDNAKDSIEWKLLYANESSGFWPPVFTDFCGKDVMLITGKINELTNLELEDTIYNNWESSFLVTNSEVYLGTKSSGGNLNGIGQAQFSLRNGPWVDFTYRNNGEQHRFKGRKL